MDLNNSIKNKASIEYKYTVDPEVIDGVDGGSETNEVITIVNSEIKKADIIIKKLASNSIAYVGDIIRYDLQITNTGNVPANKVALTDALPLTSEYVTNSLKTNESVTGNPTSTITLNNSIQPGQSVYISFSVKIMDIPNPNPMINKALANYSYIIDLEEPHEVNKVSVSNIVETFVPRYNFEQQITDIITSISLEETALGNILNAESRKIQAIVENSNATQQEILYINKSVINTIESIEILEAILRQKLKVFNCQMEGNCKW